jgi:class 3 adenylate cyclase
VSILFTDIVGFTTISAKSSPLQVLQMLNALYHEFDQLVEKNNLYKVETIGDAYMCIGGAHTPAEDQFSSIGNMALDMVRLLTAHSGRQ